MKRVVSWVVGIAVMIAIVLGMKYYNKGKTEKEVKQQASEVVQRIPGYDKDPAYYDSLLEAAHPAAFDSAYKMGGRRQSAKFDAERYLERLFEGMKTKAGADQRPEVVQAIGLLGETRNSSPPNPNE